MNAWIAAGGSPERLALYQQLATVRTFAEGPSRCLAAIHPALPDVGAIGDWRGSDAVRLQAEAWLAERGATVARGPMEVCTWFPYRANLGPHDERTFSLEPTEPVHRWLHAGYAPAAHYSTAEVAHDALLTRAERAREQLAPLGWRVEPLRADEGAHLSRARYDELIVEVHRLSMLAFADAYAFAPIPLGALAALYEPLRERLDPTLVFLVYAPDGRVVGFLFCLVDAGPPQRLLLKSLALEREARGLGLSWWLIGAAHATAASRGMPHALHCLRHEDSVSMRLHAHQERVIRRYALLEKSLLS